MLQTEGSVSGKYFHTNPDNHRRQIGEWRIFVRIKQCHDSSTNYKLVCCQNPTISYNDQKHGRLNNSFRLNIWNATSICDRKAGCNCSRTLATYSEQPLDGQDELGNLDIEIYPDITFLAHSFELLGPPRRAGGPLQVSPWHQSRVLHSQGRLPTAIRAHVMRFGEHWWDTQLRGIYHLIYFRHYIP